MYTFTRITVWLLWYLEKEISKSVMSLRLQRWFSVTGDLKSNTKSAGEKDIRMGRIATSEINMKVPVLLDLQNSVARDNVQRLSIKKLWYLVQIIISVDLLSLWL